ncbi:glucose-6-phosphate isomerase [Striga asiatica]|uniref:Glucose-6-phosphate isomerase n=1 Tax=Striga asiatica TaxID=4170 RepID=A0A5A7PZF2_STRAF|nr:glucose-6-phosphate isomerase [Striga asiatica]
MSDARHQPAKEGFDRRREIEATRTSKTQALVRPRSSSLCISAREMKVASIRLNGEALKAWFVNSSEGGRPRRDPAQGLHPIPKLQKGFLLIAESARKTRQTGPGRRQTGHLWIPLFYSVLLNKKTIFGSLIDDPWKSPSSGVFRWDRVFPGVVKVLGMKLPFGGRQARKWIGKERGWGRKLASKSRGKGVQRNGSGRFPHRVGEDGQIKA